MRDHNNNTTKILWISRESVESMKLVPSKDHALDKF